MPHQVTRNETQTDSSPADVLTAPQFFAAIFPALAAQNGQLLSAQRVPQIAGRGIVAYAAYLASMEAIGCDITAARFKAQPAFQLYGVKMLTMGEVRHAEMERLQAKEAEAQRYEDLKAQKAAQIAMKALGPGGSKVLLDLVDKQRGGEPVAAARTSDIEVPADVDWS
jgi:hypothetical protein